jgi:hypothetical protein
MSDCVGGRILIEPNNYVVRVGMAYNDPQRRAPFASAQAPKVRSKKMNKGLIPSG